MATIAEMFKAEAYAEAYAEGYAEGYAEVKAEVAKNMLLMGENVEFVARITGLALTKIREIECAISQ